MYPIYPHIVPRHATYVVSEDVVRLMKTWGDSKGLRTPSAEFMLPLRQKLYDILADIFAHVSFLEEDILANRMQAYVDRCKEQGLHTVSLECAYTSCDSVLGFTRQVNSFNDTILTRQPRRGYPSSSLQMESLRGKKIALVDDVIFSGGTIVEIMNELTHHQAIVHAVISGVAVTKGKEKIEKTSIAVAGDPHSRTVYAVAEFVNIVDQICERDFYPGVPFSGREAAYPDVYNVPYVFPFCGKNLSEWASISTKEQKQFSKICLENAIALWEEVEVLNGGHSLGCDQIPRFVKGLPKDGTRFVDCLHLEWKKLN